MEVFKVLKEYPPYSVGDILIHDTAGEYYVEGKTFNRRYSINYALLRMYPDFFENLSIKPEPNITKPITAKFIELSRYIGELEGALNGFISGFNSDICKNIAKIDIKSIKKEVLIEDSLWDLIEEIEKKLKRTV